MSRLRPHQTKAKPICFIGQGLGGDIAARMNELFLQDRTMAEVSELHNFNEHAVALKQFAQEQVDQDARYQSMFV